MKNINKIKSEKKVSVGSQGNSLTQGMYQNTSYGRTENEALTYTRSGSFLLDFYAQAGAMRKNPDKALELFQKAFAEDRVKAVRILFYLRDVRGGQGERNLFRVCLEWLGENYPEVFEQLVGLVPEYGRWDDLFFDQEECFRVINNQLREDEYSETPSLLAKWLPTINSSNENTKTKARYIADKLRMSEIEYRKLIRNIRKKIKVVEEKMSACEWDKINYPSVPSQASRIYCNAFRRHDEKRYEEYLEKVEKGEEKIQAATLYPYQVYKSAQGGNDRTLEALWNNLPDYTQGKNALVVADVSGSMVGDPMSVSVSLALYFADRNKGQFKDHFITFSGNPTLQRIQGRTLYERMKSIANANWEINTNIQAVFNLVLGTAIQNGVGEDEMPETIYIISDMEFDYCADNATNFEVIEAKYKEAEYKLPNLVFWNVDARSGRNLPVQKNEQGVSLVSGFSPVIFKMVIENKTPEQVMEDTINSERYSVINLNG